MTRTPGMTQSPARPCFPLSHRDPAG
ncbi:hypothetical protein Nmel_001097, partial [Mimus melanotis]